MLNSLKNRYKCWKIARIERKLSGYWNGFTRVSVFSNNIFKTDGDQLYIYDFHMERERVKLIKELRRLKGGL
jgi:hypothetical protein